jgi:hypothetical protein
MYVPASLVVHWSVGKKMNWQFASLPPGPVTENGRVSPSVAVTRTNTRSVAWDRLNVYVFVESTGSDEHGYTTSGWIAPEQVLGTSAFASAAFPTLARC